MINRFLYKSYRFFYRTSTWRKRHFTIPGLFVLVTLAISAGLGLDATQSMIYQFFSFLVPLLAISLGWSIFFRAQFLTNRKLPKFATVGEKLIYHIEFHNKTRKKQSGLLFCETLEDPRPSMEDLLNTKEPNEDKRNIWDRKILYFRWIWLISLNIKARTKESPIPVLLPDGKGDVQAQLTPLRRGYLHLTGILVSRPDPFGLFKALITIENHQSILVLPKTYRLPPIQLPGTRKYHPGGVALSSSIGDSDEFISLRNYRPGDPIRQIHWKSWAKTGDLIIKEFEDEFFVRHALILDTFHEEPHSEIFEKAVSVAASFVCAIETQETLLDLMFVGTEAYCFSSGRGTVHTDKMMEILACVRECRDNSFSALSPLVVNYAPILSGCICILLSWDNERKEIIQHLKSLGVPMLVILITDGTSAEDSEDLSLTADFPENSFILKIGKIQEGLNQL